MKPHVVYVLALGGGASNALNRAIRTNAIELPSIAADTDAQDLKRSLAPTRLQLGTKLTKGLGRIDGMRRPVLHPEHNVHPDTSEAQRSHRP